MKECYSYALRHVQRYPKSELGLRRTLQHKGYQTDEIDETIHRLTQQNYLNDQIYAELYLRSEVAGKGKPLFVVSQRLFQKGISKEAIDASIALLGEELTAGMFARLSKEADREKKGLQGFRQKMSQRGYPYELIMKVAEACFETDR